MLLKNKILLVGLVYFTNNFAYNNISTTAESNSIESYVDLEQEPSENEDDNRYCLQPLYSGCPVYQQHCPGYNNVASPCCYQAYQQVQQQPCFNTHQQIPLQYQQLQCPICQQHLHNHYHSGSGQQEETQNQNNSSESTNENQGSSSQKKKEIIPLKITDENLPAWVIFAIKSSPNVPIFRIINDFYAAKDKASLIPLFKLEKNDHNLWYVWHNDHFDLYLFDEKSRLKSICPQKDL